MGLYPIGNYEIPGFRENLYGKFVVNLGIFLPCVWQIETEKIMMKKVVQEYFCQIRDRLGKLVEGRDIWWSLDNSPERTGEFNNRLFGEIWFALFVKIHRLFNCPFPISRDGSLPFCTEGRSSLTAAIICQHLGDAEFAREYFDLAADYAIKIGNSGFSNYVDGIRNLHSQ